MGEGGTVDLFKIGIYILLFIPGFIFVQTKDYHLLRGKKPQFEKTLEIILWTAVIWVAALSSPVWPLGSFSRTAICSAIQNCITNEKNISHLPLEITKNGSASSIFFLSVCFWSFVASNAWGILRKRPWVDSIIKFFSGRDWYPSVAFRFFNENIGKAIEVTVKDTKYVGILFSAPDKEEDKYIIITQPQIIERKDEEYVLEALKLVDFMVIKFNNIDQIKALSKDILKKKPKTKRRSWIWLRK